MTKSSGYERKRSCHYRINLPEFAWKSEVKFDSLRASNFLVAVQTGHLSIKSLEQYFPSKIKFCVLEPVLDKYEYSSIQKNVLHDLTLYKTIVTSFVVKRYFVIRYS